MIRKIAIHLPQFHPIPENDTWWGKGFTEWTNVTKAKPLFHGHHQPHLPADLGFYDLRLEETRMAQESMAKEYGIYGFCYYHYWFNGKRLLQEPLERKLNNPKEDLPFMLCWANENWTRRWDGGDETILIKQNYSAQDAEEHCKCLIRFFKDKRYIRINGKPVFAVYKSWLLPDNIPYMEVFKKTAQQFGVELYLIRFEAHEKFGATFMNGYDAAAEFEPFSYWLNEYRIEKYFSQFKNIIKKIKLDFIYKGEQYLKKRQHILSKSHRLKKINYSSYVDFITSRYSYPNDYTRFPCATPMWDNTARRGKDAFYFYNSSPQAFGKWLNFHKKNYQPVSAEENLFFINAWNEWAEGNHLEPCQKWGTAFLEEVAKL